MIDHNQINYSRFLETMQKIPVDTLGDLHLMLKTIHPELSEMESAVCMRNGCYMLGMIRDGAKYIIIPLIRVLKYAPAECVTMPIISELKRLPPSGPVLLDDFIAKISKYNPSWDAGKTLDFADVWLKAAKIIVFREYLLPPDND